MKDYKPVHGVDYLCNHYAILELEQDATKDQIKKAYYKKSKQWHPDIFSNAAPEMKRKAESKFNLLTRSYKTLKDTEKRKVYDEKLNNFNPKLISKSGRPIIDIFAKRVDTNYLLSNEEWDDKNMYLEYIKEQSKYDENIFNILEQQYNSAKDPSEELKGAYKTALRNKEAYFALLEDMAWDEAGILNQEDIKIIANPKDHILRREEQIETTKNRIEENIETRVLALTSGEAPLLLTDGKRYDGKIKKKERDELKEKLSKIAKSKFESFIPNIKKAAEKRAEVLEELVELTEWEYFPPDQDMHKDLMVLITSDNEIKMEITTRYINSNDVTPSPSMDYHQTPLEEFKSDKKEIKKILDSGKSIAILYRNKDINSFLEATHIIEKHLDLLNN